MPYTYPTALHLHIGLGVPDRLRVSRLGRRLHPIRPDVQEKKEAEIFLPPLLFDGLC